MQQRRRLLAGILSAALLGTLGVLPAAAEDQDPLTAVQQRLDELEDAIASVGDAAPDEVDPVALTEMYRETLDELDRSIAEFPEEPLFVDLREFLLELAELAELDLDGADGPDGDPADEESDPTDEGSSQDAAEGAGGDREETAELGPFAAGDQAAFAAGDEAGLTTGDEAGRAAADGPAFGLLAIDREPTVEFPLDPVARDYHEVQMLEPRLLLDNRSIRSGEGPSSQYAFDLIALDSGDLDGNGSPDIVSLSAGRAESANDEPDVFGTFLVVQRTDGFGEVETGTAYLTNTTGWRMDPEAGLALGDVDQDGDLDIVLSGGTDRTITTLFNDGTGSFPEQVVTEIAQAADRALRLVDLDGDGLLDIATIAYADNMVVTLLGNGDGTFRADATISVPLPTSVSVMDLDGSGEPVLVTTGYQYMNFTTLQWWERGEDGTWVETALDAPAGAGEQTWIGDVDGDGLQDVVLLSSSSFGPTCTGATGVYCLATYRNTGGSFEKLAQVATVGWLETSRGSDPAMVVDGRLVDVDGDGHLDVVLPDAYGAVRIHYGDGAGDFRESELWAGAPGPDNAHDWSEADNGSGIFQSGRAVVVDDFTGDGVNDFLVANRTPQYVRNAGTRQGSLSLVEGLDDRTYAAPRNWHQIQGNYWQARPIHDLTRLVDWDGDGRLDLVTPAKHWVDGVHRSSLVVVPGTAGGGFGEPYSAGDMSAGCHEGATSWSTLTIGDIDGDGALDVVCGDHELFVGYGDGTGRLRSLGATTYKSLGRTSDTIYIDLAGIALTDVDGDGDLDVLYGTLRSRNSVSLVGWAENVGGELQPVQTLAEHDPDQAAVSTGTTNYLSHRAVVRDVTGDGFVDVVFTLYRVGTQAAGGNLLVYESDGEGGFTPHVQQVTLPDNIVNLSAGDLDGDGDVDLIGTYNWSYGNYGEMGAHVTLLFNDGSGRFTGRVLQTDGAAHGLWRVADMDLDGTADLITASTHRGVTVRRGLGGGEFAQPRLFTASSHNMWWADVADLDGDGDLDVVGATDRTLNHSVNATRPHQLVVMKNLAAEGGAGPGDGPNLSPDPVSVTRGGVATDPFDGGGAVDLAVTVRNTGDTPTRARWTDTVWLSTDATWDVGDTLVATIPRTGSLRPGAATTARVSVEIDPLLHGTQHLIVRTDTRGQIAESDETDNTSVLDVEADVAELSAGGQITRDLTAGRTAIVRIGAQDQPVRLTLTGPDGADLAVRANRVPTAAAADLRRTGPGGVVLPTSGDVRYVKVTLPQGVSGQVTLALASLPFGIASASATRLSNTGPATILMSGTGLEQATGVFLVAGDGTEIRAHRFVSVGEFAPIGEQLSATFELTGATPGLYDLLVTDGSSRSELPGGVRVVAGQAGALQTSVFVPPRVRPGTRTVDAYVSFSNSGLSDVVTPFYSVRSTGMGMLNHLAVHNQLFYAVPTVEGAPAGVVPPGASGRVTIEFVPASIFSMTVEERSADDLAPFDWVTYALSAVHPAQQAQLRPVLERELGRTAGSIVPTMHAYRADLLADGKQVDRLESLLWMWVGEQTDEAADPRPVVTGRVLGPDGALPGARVEVTLGEAQEVATTDVDGRFRVRVAAAGVHQVRVSAPGFAPLDSTVTARPGSVDTGDLTVVAGGSVRGVVRSAETGLPLGGVNVGVVGTTSVVTTGPDGAYVLGSLPHGSTALGVNAEGYLPQRVEVVLGTAVRVQDIVLTTAGALTVTVHDSQGTPVPDAQVQAIGQGTDGDDGPGMFGATASAEGVAILADLPPGDYLLTSGSAQLAVSYDGTATDVVLAERDSVVTGRIVDGDDQPVADVDVVLVGSSGTTAARTTADGSGRFSLTAAAGVSAVVQVLAPEVGALRHPVTFPASGETTDLGDLGPDGVTLSVLLPGNTVPPLVTLTVDSPDGAGDQLFVAPDGSADPTVVTVPDVGPGTYVVRADVGLDHPALGKVTVADDAVSLTLELPGAGWASGTALDRDGNAAAGLRVLLGSDDGLHEYETTSGTGGSWSLDVVPGDYTLVVLDADGIVLIEDYTAPRMELRGFGDAIVGPATTTGIGARPVAWTAPAAVPAPASVPAPAANPTTGPAVVVQVLPMAAHDGLTDPDTTYCTPTRQTYGFYTLKGQVTNPVIWGNYDGLPTTVKLRLHGSSMVLATMQVDPASGKFTSPGLGDASYDLVIEVEGHETVVQGPFVVPLATTQYVGSVARLVHCSVDIGGVDHGDEIKIPGQTPRHLSAGEIFDAWIDRFTWEGVPTVDPTISAILAAEIPEPQECRTSIDTGNLTRAKRHAQFAEQLRIQLGKASLQIHKQLPMAVLEIGLRGAQLVKAVIDVVVPVLKALKEVNYFVNWATKWNKLAVSTEDAELVAATAKVAAEIAEFSLNYAGKLADKAALIYTVAVDAIYSGDTAGLEREFGLLISLGKEVIEVLETAAPRWAKAIGKEVLTRVGAVLGAIDLAINAYKFLPDQTKTFKDAIQLVENLIKSMDEMLEKYEWRVERAKSDWAAWGAQDKTTRPIDPCEPPPPPGPRGPYGPHGGSIMVSVDPNEIVGPQGVGSERWVQADTEATYYVTFENLGPGSQVVPEGAKLADAPAALVDVTLPIDTDLDLGSVELGPFGFGDTVYDVPVGSRSFTDVRDFVVTLPGAGGSGSTDVTLTLTARAWVDVTARAVRWVIEATDPATGVVHADPLAGFLPPEPVDDVGAGQGFATVFARPVAGSPTGTTLTAKASIVFDANDPIVTNEWSNRLDRDAPSTTVTAAASTPVGASVGWTSRDQGAGAGVFDVFRSVDGGELALWKSRVSASQVALEGEVGQRVGLAVRAADRVWNLEPTPSAPQVVTVLTEPTTPSGPGSGGSDPGGSGDGGSVPGPGSGPGGSPGAGSPTGPSGTGSGGGDPSGTDGGDADGDGTGSGDAGGPDGTAGPDDTAGSGEPVDAGDATGDAVADPERGPRPVGLLVGLLTLLAAIVAAALIWRRTAARGAGGPSSG